MREVFKLLIAQVKLLTQGRYAMVGPVSLWKMKREFQIRFLKDMGLKPEHYLLDIGCGTLRGGIPLIDYLEPARYFGVEERANVLVEARKELRDFGLEGKNPTLLLTPDLSQVVINQKFDYAWAFSVLIHMSDEILEDTLGFVRRQLSENGAFYANVKIGKTLDGFWQGFPTVTRPLEFYQQVCARNGLAFSDVGSLKDHGHVSNIESQDSQRILKITKTD